MVMVVVLMMRGFTVTVLATVGAILVERLMVVMILVVMVSPSVGHVTEIGRAHDGHDRARIGDGDDLTGLNRDEHPHMQKATPFMRVFLPGPT